MDIDTPIEQSKFSAKRGFGQHFPGYDRAAVLEQMFQDIEFDGSHFELSVAALHAAQSRRERDGAYTDPIATTGRARSLGPSQDGTYARDQLARVTRLRKVIVGADLESNNAIDRFAATGQQQNRKTGTLTKIAE